MAYYIRLDDDETIDLPTEYELQERIELCERIIEEYPKYFEQHIAGSNCSEQVARKTEIRLDIMANYILNSASTIERAPVLSRYKQKRVQNTEKSFSDLEHKYNFNENS